MVPGQQNGAHDTEPDGIGVLGDRRVEHLGRGDGEAGRAEMLFGGAPAGKTQPVGERDLFDHLPVALGDIDAFHHLGFLQQSD